MVYQSWLSIDGHYDKKGQIDVVKEIEEDFNTDEQKIIKAQKVGSTVYMAVQDTNTNYISAYVVLTHIENSYQKYINIKIFEEDEEPYYYDCPTSILKVLSPTDNPNALAWRRACERRQEEKKTSYAVIGNSNVGDRFIYDDQRILEHRPKGQCCMKQDWWYVIGEDARLPKNLISLDAPMVEYTRENVERSFCNIMKFHTTEDLTHGVPVFIMSNNRLRLPAYCSHLVVKTGEYCEGNSDLVPAFPLNEFFMTYKDGKIVFTSDDPSRTEIRNIYDINDFPTSCQKVIKNFEDLVKFYYKNYKTPERLREEFLGLNEDIEEDKDDYEEER